MGHKKILKITAVFLALHLNAQSQRCATIEYKRIEETKNSGLKELRQQRLTERIERFRFSQDKFLQTITIPVVVHVLYNTAEQNVSDEKIIEQIDVLNNDYARKNQDAASTPSAFQSIAAGTGIQFCLAKRDPNGKPTTGIVRKFTTETAFAIGDDVKFNVSGGANAWPANDYLNLWICNLQGSLLGFATFPGSAAATDGVVIYYQTIGGPDKIGINNAYSLGRTLTHEVGHWLGLYHIWGDDGESCTGTDYVDDTPNQADEHYGVPVFPVISCNNNPNGDMFMNFMDYTDDFGMNSFTTGQADVMSDVMQFDRVSLLTSNGCVAPAAISVDAAVAAIGPQEILCSQSFGAAVILKNAGTSSITSAKIKYAVDDDSMLTFNWTGTLAAGASDTVELTGLTALDGIHHFTVQCTLVNGVAETVNTSNNISVKEFTVASYAFSLPFTEDFEAKLFPSQAWNIMNSDNGTIWMRTNIAAKTGKASLWINENSSTSKGTYDDVTIKPLNFSTITHPYLAFDVAYQYNDADTNTHTLEVLASSDCGQTWTVVSSKSNNTLATSIGVETIFSPSPTQWRKDTLSLIAFAGRASVILKFRNIAGNCKGLFIDDIKIGSVRDIFPDAGNITFSITPNPTKGEMNFNLILLENSEATLRIFDSRGRKVFERNYTGETASDRIYLKQLRAGVYSAQVLSGGNKKAMKIVVY